MEYHTGAFWLVCTMAYFPRRIIFQRTFCLPFMTAWIGVRLLGALSQLDLSSKDVNATRAKQVAKELATNSSVASLV
jgi:hypothetical protein